VSPTDWLLFAGGLVVMTGLTTALAHWGGLRLGWDPVVALARAAVQLSAIALLLHGILSVPWTVVAFVALMLTTASVTSIRRLRELHHGALAAVAGVLVGSLLAVGLVFALHLVAWETRYLIAVSGIVIGNAMNAATLAGRNFLRTSRREEGSIEGWFALGATPSQAHAEIGRESVRESVLPNLDQTRATGLVTLPGAFVGALFGGASPTEAAMFQLVVLAAIGVAMVSTGLVVTRTAGRTPFLPVPDEIR
jgi:putative ABC transport system permease protein